MTAENRSVPSLVGDDALDAEAANGARQFLLAGGDVVEREACKVVSITTKLQLINRFVVNHATFEYYLIKCKKLTIVKGYCFKQLIIKKGQG